jgi:hypothetical protein
MQTTPSPHQNGETMPRRTSLINALRLLSIFTLLAFQGEPQAAPPEVKAELSIVSGGSSSHFQGWPLVLFIDIRHSDGALAKLRGSNLTPITVSTSTGSWARLVKIVVKNPQGRVQRWPFQLTRTPGNDLVLDATHSGRLMVTLSASATAAIAPGTYRIRLWFDARTGTTETSWKGWATDGIELKFNGPPTSLTSEQKCEKGHASAGYHLAHGNSSQALAALDSALTEAPDEVLCLSARAELAASAGKTYEAIDFYQRAILAQSRLPSSEPRGDGVLGDACRALTNTLPPSERNPLVECGYRRSTP